MTEEPKVPLLRRMTRAGRPPREVGEVSPAKALRLALSKAGQEVLKQLVVGSGVEERRLPLTAIADHLPEGGLTTHLSGPGGCGGLVTLDRAVMSGVIEALTLGQVLPTPPSDRPPSITDGLLCQRFLVMVMTVFAARLLGHPGEEWATGFVPEDPIQDLRRLPLMLDDVLYRAITVEIDMGGGSKIGQMVLVLPWDGQTKDAPEPEAEPTSKVAADKWRADLENAVMPCSPVFTGVLHSLELPLEYVLTLKPGDTVPLHGAALDDVRLETQEGLCLARGRLGQSRGNRAVRLTASTMLPGFDADPPKEEPENDAPPMPSLVDTMANMPPLGDIGGATDIDPNGEDLPPLEGLGDADIGGLPPLSVGDEADGTDDLPPLDMDNMSFEGLDDLPMTIE